MRVAVLNLWAESQVAAHENVKPIWAIPKFDEADLKPKMRVR